jgi:hypothetical protein
MTALPHATLTDWEIALTRQFLMVSGDDSTPLRSVEISSATLAVSASIDSASRDEVALRAFKNALCADRTKLIAALERGIYRRYDDGECLGCFAFLALTILVDSLLEAEVGASEFRAKLASFLGINRSFSQLSGINSMWEQLRDWLADQADNGKPYRRLILPEENSWNHIGYSVRLSFPSRKDRTFIGNFLDANPDIFSNERLLVERFRSSIAGGRASVGMQIAFGEFHTAYLAGQRTLADHRFWRFVQAIGTSRHLSLATEIDLDLSSDEDGLKVFSLRDIASEDAGKEMCDSLGDAARAALAFPRNNFTQCIEIGYVLFMRIGHSRWKAVSSLSECHGTVHVGLTSRLAGIIGASLGALETSGNWYLTKAAVLVGKAEDVLRRFVRAGDVSNQISHVRVYGGVRTGSNWLGRPSFLPQISSDGGALVLDQQHGGGLPAPVCEEIDGWPGTYVIKSDRPLDGNYGLRPSIASTGLTWSRNVAFARNAVVHGAEARQPSGRPLGEWTDTVTQKAFVAIPDLEWCDLPQSLDDTIEAVYAGGRTGWSEGDLIPRLQDVLPKEISPWDFLRSMHESTLLQPLLRPGFRGRTWRLNRPRLVPLQTMSGDILVVDGCLGAVLASDFRSAVLSLGGNPFRLRGIPQWSIPLVGAMGVSIDDVARRLDWQSSAASSPGDRRWAFEQTRIRRDHYDRASVWSWKDRRFSTRANLATSEVVLERWVHRAQRDHDIYVVSNRDRESRFLSRSAAIALVHGVAGIPLFQRDGNTLRRTAREGALPVEISKWLRHRNLQNPTVVDGGSYQYPVRRDDYMKLAAILPRMVNLGVEVADRSSFVASVRRSAWSTRLIWTDGGLSSRRAFSVSDERNPR